MNIAKLPILLLATLGIVVLGHPRVTQEKRETPYKLLAEDDIRAVYNQLEDKTYVSTFIPITTEPAREISRFEISAGFSYQGRDPGTPDVVQLAVQLPCSFSRNLQNNPIICFDEECFTLKPLDICEGGLGRERVSHLLNLPYQTFSTVVNAQRVKVQLGNTTVALADKERNVLRKFAGWTVH